jgi:hypothetical protein
MRQSKDMVDSEWRLEPVRGARGKSATPTRVYFFRRCCLRFSLKSKALFEIDYQPGEYSQPKYYEHDFDRLRGNRSNEAARTASADRVESPSYPDSKKGRS